MKIISENIKLIEDCQFESEGGFLTNLQNWQDLKCQALAENKIIRDLIEEWRRRVTAIGRDVGTYKSCADELDAALRSLISGDTSNG